MKIVMDCTNMLEESYGGGGIEHYIYQVARHGMRVAGIELILIFKSGQEIPEWAQEKAIVYTKKFVILDRHRAFKIFLNAQDADMYFFPTGMVPYGFKKPYAITIHDLAILKHPEWFLNQWLATKVVLPYSIRHASKVIAVSEHTAKDLKQFFPYTVESKVIHLGYELLDIHEDQELGILSKYNLSSKEYFFFVGTIEPRKNIIRLIAAYQKAGKSIPLVIAGKKGWKYVEIVKRMKTAKNVRYIGYISELDKQVLLKNTKGLLWPSLYEGFGLPVLEAAALSVPILTSKGTSMEEIVGAGAVLVDPEDVENIAKGIIQLSKENPTYGVENMTWEKTASETFNFLVK